MKTLANQMKELNMTDAALARLVQCDRTMITRIRNRQATPSVPLAIAIIEHTGADLKSLVPEAEAEAAE